MYMLTNLYCFCNSNIKIYASDIIKNGLKNKIFIKAYMLYLYYIYRNSLLYV